MREFLSTCNHYLPGGLIIHTTELSNNINTNKDPNVKYYSHRLGDWKQNHRVAKRDIKKGEEMFEDYNYGCKAAGTWVEDLYMHYLPDRIKFERDFGIKPETNFDWP